MQDSVYTSKGLRAVYRANIQGTGIKDPNFRVHEKASKDPRSDLRSTLRASSKVKPRRSPAARTTQALASLLCFRHPSHSLATLYPPYGTRLGQARHQLCRRAAGLISLSTAAPGANTSPGRLQRRSPDVRHLDVAASSPRTCVPRRASRHPHRGRMACGSLDVDAAAL